MIDKKEELNRLNKLISDVKSFLMEIATAIEDCDRKLEAYAYMEEDELRADEEKINDIKEDRYEYLETQIKYKIKLEDLIKQSCWLHDDINYIKPKPSTILPTSKKSMY